MSSFGTRRPSRGRLDSPNQIEALRKIGVCALQATIFGTRIEHNIVSLKGFQFCHICAILRHGLAIHHTPAARHLHDRGLSPGSVVPTCHGWHDFGCGHGGRYVHGRNGGRDRKRHAVLSFKGSGADRLRQVRVYGGLQRQMLHRLVGSRILSFFCGVQPNRAAAKRFLARRPGPSPSRASSSNSGLIGAEAPGCCCVAWSRADQCMPPCGGPQTIEDLK